MSEIERYDVNEQWAHSGIIRAGDFCLSLDEGLRLLCATIPLRRTFGDGPRSTDSW